ncbi:hypothetical protein DFJ73DRAFT_587214 [Zopfochytrium polystomum]|nr:hypothetical protein DFJ73DRAFT_587214 [Zopfochytrium polystomum]
MKVVILLTGTDPLEQEVLQLAPSNAQLSTLYGIPKSLLPVGGQPVLSWTWAHLRATGLDGSTAIVTDARNYKAVERWSLASGFSLDRVFNTGNIFEAQSRDFLSALDLLISLGIIDVSFPDCTTILSADLLFDYDDLYSAGFVDAMLGTSSSDQCAIVRTKGSPPSEGPVFVRVSASSIPLVEKFLTENDVAGAGVNSFVQWLSERTSLRELLISSEDTPIWKWLSRVSAQNYVDVWARKVPRMQQLGAPNEFARSVSPMPISSSPIVSRAHARIGLLGNPSDGFFGKTISVLISNYWAEATIIPNADPKDESIVLCPNPLCDPLAFPSISVATKVCSSDGYYGVSRLLLATMKIFDGYCRANGLRLRKQGFKLLWNTNIPRQVGLAGSSGIITAFLGGLIKHHDLDEPGLIPPYIRANLALSAEKDELGIAAGLQDRVIQAYGGMVFMDFNKEQMLTRGYGEYYHLDINQLPKGLWLAYVAQPSDSGTFHSNVRSRFNNGEQEVVDGMNFLASLAEEAKVALANRDEKRLAELMDMNLGGRRSLYGEKALGTANMVIVDIARRHGHAAKFSGSGGCVIGLWKGEPDDPLRESRTRQMVVELRKSGFVFQKIIPAPPLV